MTTTNPEIAVVPKLRCLGGGDAPPEIAGDLLRLLDLPERVRQRLWEALGPSLAEPVPPSVEALLDDFCHRHAIPGDPLARVLKACRFLVREASKRDLPRAELAQDLATLVAGEDEIHRVLLAGYDQAKAAIRRDILRSALIDHGKVLTGVDWRLDTIAASAHGASIQAPVVLLTLRYQDGDRSERITLQATVGVLQELRGLCDQLLG